MAVATFSVNFTVRKTKNDPTTANVYAVITKDGEQPAEMCLPGKIQHAKWDGKKEQVGGNSVDAKSLNVHINNIRVNLTIAYRDLVDAQEPFTAQDVKNHYLGERAPANRDYTLLKLLDKHGTEWKGKLAPGSMKNYDTTETYIKNFIKYKLAQSKKSGDDLPVACVNYGFLSEFEYYIPNHPIQSHKPCTANGTAKHIERFKKLVKWAYKLDWIKKNTVEKYTPHTTKKHRNKLKFHHIKLLADAKFGDPNLRFVRDLFLFSVYTGMSYAEVSTLSVNDFEISPSGKFFCTKYRTKSGEPFAVSILPDAIQIIKRYMQSEKSIARGTIFPKITNQQVNRALKVIQEILSIPIVLTFHVARHTFATTIALKNGVPITTVQIILGHKKLATTQIYTEVDENKVEEDMDKLEIALQKRLQLPSPSEYLKRLPLSATS